MGRRPSTSQAKTFDDSVESALRQSFKLLGYRDRSEREMREKLLKKGFSSGVVEQTVALLREKGFVDDEKLAEALRRDAVERRCLGAQGVRAYLIKRGIPRDRAEALAADAGGADDDVYVEAARRLVEKRKGRMGRLDEGTVKRRLWGLLARRGFSADSIREAMKSLDIEEDA